MTALSDAQRTRIVAADSAVRLEVDGASHDVYILLDADRAPRLLVTGGGEVARLFDLGNVTTRAHGWLDDDGLDADDPDVRVRASDDLHDVLIRGVVEHMVAIDHAPHVDEHPRLLFWTDHAHDDQEPRKVRL